MKDRLLHLLLGVVFIFSLSLCSCAGHKARRASVFKAEPTAQADTARRPGVVVQPPRTVLDKLTGRTRPPVHYPPGTPVVAGKKSTITINHVAGNQANTTSSTGKKATSATGEAATATAIEKAKAPVATSTGDATDQAGTGVASTIKGDNNTPVLTNTAPQALGWKAQLAQSLAPPVGKGIAIGLLALLAFGVYRFWPVLRRDNSANSTV